MKILVVGASGLVGGYVYKYFSHNNYKVLGTFYKNKSANLVYFDKLDRRTSMEVFDNFMPDIVIDTSYETNVDKCEFDTTCAELNIEGTKNIVDIVKKRRGLLIFLSSDYVFDGENGPYSEEDKPNPINIYGRQKLESERIIQKELDKFLIVRVATVYGFKDGSRNTLQKLKDAEKEGKIIRYVDDQWVTPTYVEDIARGIELLIKNNRSGIWHISSGQFMTRYEFVNKLSTEYNINVKIERILTNQMNDKVARPKRCGLTISRIKKLGFIPKIL